MHYDLKKKIAMKHFQCFRKQMGSKFKSGLPVRSGWMSLEDVLHSVSFNSQNQQKYLKSSQCHNVWSQQNDRQIGRNNRILLGFISNHFNWRLEHEMCYNKVCSTTLWWPEEKPSESLSGYKRTIINWPRDFSLKIITVNISMILKQKTAIQPMDDSFIAQTKKRGKWSQRGHSHVEYVPWSTTVNQRFIKL